MLVEWEWHYGIIGVVILVVSFTEHAIEYCGGSCRGFDIELRDYIQ